MNLFRTNKIIGLEAVNEETLIAQAKERIAELASEIGVLEAKKYQLTAESDQRIAILQEKLQAAKDLNSAKTEEITRLNNNLAKLIDGYKPATTSIIK